MAGFQTFDANTGFQPDGGANLDFSGFAFDILYTNANQYEEASVTQLFYLNNVMLFFSLRLDAIQYLRKAMQKQINLANHCLFPVVVTSSMAKTC